MSSVALGLLLLLIGATCTHAGESCSSPSYYYDNISLQAKHPAASQALFSSACRLCVLLCCLRVHLSCYVAMFQDFMSSVAKVASASSYGYGYGSEVVELKVDSYSHCAATAWEDILFAE